MQRSRNMVHSHFTPCLRVHETAFPTPIVRPLDESQGSSPLQDHGSWLVCEVALGRWSIYLSIYLDTIVSGMCKCRRVVHTNNRNLVGIDNFEHTTNIYSSKIRIQSRYGTRTSIFKTITSGGFLHPTRTSAPCLHTQVHPPRQSGSSTYYGLVGQEIRCMDASHHSDP